MDGAGRAVLGFLGGWGNPPGVRRQAVGAEAELQPCLTSPTSTLTGVQPTALTGGL